MNLYLNKPRSVVLIGWLIIMPKANVTLVNPAVDVMMIAFAKICGK
jgi:hypothetical protein